MASSFMMKPSVTIVIPTLNGAEWLEHGIPEFLAQNYAGEWDFLIIDSGSEDGTKALFTSIPNARFHPISRGEFGHGKTRNLALSLTQSDLLLFTVQDARPMHDQWIDNMVSALLESETDAVCGGQAVPHEADKNPLAWYRPLSNTREVKKVIASGYDKATGIQRMQLCSWDNVNALYKRSALELTPFEDVRFAEDISWAKSHLEAGGSIGYTGNSKVCHYHHHTPHFTWQRTLSKLYWQHHHFNTLPPLPTRPTMSGLLQALKVLTYNSKIFNPFRILFWLNYNWTSKTASYRAGLAFSEAHARGQLHIDELYASMGKQSPLAPQNKA